VQELMFLDTVWRSSYPCGGGKRSSAAPSPSFPVPLFLETKMRRIFALLLLTPLLANCADSATPVASAPAGAVLSEGDVPTEPDAEGEWFTEENWWTPGDALALAEEEMSVQAVGSPGAPAAVTMVLGNPDAGTSYPAAHHDGSFHSRDRMIPGTVSIPVGGTVKFEVLPGHRMAIYDDGVMPADIPNIGTGVGINYPVKRLFLQLNPLYPTIKFTRPGKYLVICVVKSHFFNANMWGWVVVH
jgi:plastocyanin